MTEEQEKICRQNHCVFWSEYYDEEEDIYYDRCGTLYDAPKELIPKDCSHPSGFINVS